MNPQVRRLALDFGPLIIFGAVYFASGKNIFAATATLIPAVLAALAIASTSSFVTSAAMTSSSATDIFSRTCRFRPPAVRRHNERGEQRRKREEDGGEGAVYILLRR